MHFHGGKIPIAYTRYLHTKRLVIISSAVLLILAFMVALSVGSAPVPLSEVVKSLCGLDVINRHSIIVTKIRLPQAITAIIAGAGLALSGVVMQAILRNPLASPFTLGISHAAAFGAAFSVMIFGGNALNSSTNITITGPMQTTLAAFICAILAASLIIAISKRRGATAEMMILSGVALAALCTAGTKFLQFFADDVQLAAMVFWSFGDTARASWWEISFMAAIIIPSAIYFIANSWNYNSIETGEETALGLGINTKRLRLFGMLLSSLVTAVIISFLGIIGFIGLVIPHLVRRLIGADHRYLLPCAMLIGSLLLLVADTIARIILAPNILPVSVLTAFLGAPVFLYLIIRNH